MIWTVATAAQSTVTPPNQTTTAESSTDGVKWEFAGPADLAVRIARRARVVLAKSAEEWSDPA